MSGLPLAARRLGAVMNGRVYPAIKIALCSQWRRERLLSWASGESVPTLAEKKTLHDKSGGFLTHDGWASPRRVRRSEAERSA